LIHACLIEYPKYFDPVSRLPCPPEVVVQRLSVAANLSQPWYLRPLAKIQGSFASQAHLWRLNLFPQNGYGFGASDML
jgi:capsular polysaccharide export protein